jgi:hypothetical protein
MTQRWPFTEKSTRLSPCTAYFISLAMPMIRIFPVIEHIVKATQNTQSQSDKEKQ